MLVSLIANSGIQFHKFDININPNETLIRPVGFCESIELTDDATSTRVSLEYAYFEPQNEIWAKKKDLKEQEYLNDRNEIITEINYNILKLLEIKEDDEFNVRYSISNISNCLDLFVSTEKENIWIPIPYFKINSSQTSNFGPTAWARMAINKHSDNIKNKYKIILAFDTKIELDRLENNYAPNSEDTNENENIFGLVDNEDFLLSFLDASNNCEWVEKSLKTIAEKKGKLGRQENLKYLSHYIYMIKYFQTMKISSEDKEQVKVFPDVLLYSDKNRSIDVDLVLDIGNSNTCGLLFESVDGNFDFNSVKKLKLYDLTSLENEYSEPFSMRLAFVESNFGDIFIPGYSNFRWPSLIRLGEEANNCIKSSNFDETKGVEFTTHHSSPKRYLWDNKKADVPWQFVNFSGIDGNRAIYYEGVSEQFKENGEFAYDAVFHCMPTYSRKSLMTLVFNEIFLHALSQINSFEFRQSHGNPNRPRRLRRITITCPTSIIQEEQVVLRKCALEAFRLINRFYNNSYLEKYDINDKEDFEIIPNPKDLSKKLNELEYKNDWIYDEATCCQFVFLYSELSKRFLNKADVFFDLYGKMRADSIIPEQNSLTVASLDIGGGTSDLMICNYEYDKGQGLSVINPYPLFWESFNLAGDDLLKEIVQQIIIEGLSDEKFKGVFGIKNAASKAGVSNLAEKLNNFFGSINNNQTFKHRIIKKNFLSQIAIPIAIKYLEHTSKDIEDIEVDFKYFFPKNDTNPQLLKYFNDHFSPLKFEDIKWRLSADAINSITEIVFEPLLKQLSAIMSAYGCDFVLLAGRLTMMPKLRQMFIKYYPTSPDRIISLNNYRVGRWYPFADDIGYFKDPKTIVSVGAVIALMSKLDRLEGFRINTKNLKQKLISTSEYIGVLNRETQNLVEINLTPEDNTSNLKISALPAYLGYKQLKNNCYIARPLYKIELNKEYFIKITKNQFPNLKTDNEVNRTSENLINSFKSRMPLKLTIQREWNESKEIVNIETIIDNEGNEVSKQTLSPSFLTLPSEKGYWLDSGEFVLNIM
jgi:hypothetical protein